MKLLTKIFAIVLIGSTVVACTDSKKESKAETAMEEIKDSFKSEQSDLKLELEEMKLDVETKQKDK